MLGTRDSVTSVWITLWLEPEWDVGVHAAFRGRQQTGISTRISFLKIVFLLIKTGSMLRVLGRRSGLPGSASQQPGGTPRWEGVTGEACFVFALGPLAGRCSQKKWGALLGAWASSLWGRGGCPVGGVIGVEGRGLAGLRAVGGSSLWVLPLQTPPQAAARLPCCFLC